MGVEEVEMGVVGWNGRHGEVKRSGMARRNMRSGILYNEAELGAGVRLPPRR